MNEGPRAGFARMTAAIAALFKGRPMWRSGVPKRLQLLAWYLIAGGVISAWDGTVIWILRIFKASDPLAAAPASWWLQYFAVMIGDVYVGISIGRRTRFGFIVGCVIFLWPFYLLLTGQPTPDGEPMEWYDPLTEGVALLLLASAWREFFPREETLADRRPSGQTSPVTSPAEGA